MTFSAVRVFGVCAATLVLVVGLSSCSRNRNQDIPTGVQTLSGTLVPVPLSLTRRGTHELQQDNRAVYLVESTSADLRDFEGLDVVVTGTVERNIDPDALPVLVASGVTLIHVPVSHWDVPALSLNLDAPVSWSGHVFDDGIRFTQTGGEAVLLDAHTSIYTQLPPGERMQVGGRSAIRTTESGTLNVYVLNGRDVIIFSLHPQDPSMQEQLEKSFNVLLHSVQFSGSTTSSATSRTTGTGAASADSGMPCGGPAGVLCPQGQYCAITDPVEGIGHCRALKR